MSPHGRGGSFIVTSNVVGVYMELCISLKVWDSVVRYWPWSALKFSNFKIIVQFIDPYPVHQRTPWTFCFLLRWPLNMVSQWEPEAINLGFSISAAVAVLRHLKFNKLTLYISVYM